MTAETTTYDPARQGNVRSDGNAWVVVAASAFALILGAGSIQLYASGMFIGPVTESLGIGRGTFSFGMMAGSITSAIGCLIIGALIDKLGPRRVMVWGIPAFAVLTASFSLMPSSIVGIAAIFAVFGIISPAASPLTYGAVIVRWFREHQGLALGIAVTGSGTGIMVLPPIIDWLISGFGWRTAYILLGVGILVFSWVPVLLFVREPASAVRQRAAKDPAEREPPFVYSSVFLRLAGAFILAVPAVAAVLTHALVMLGDRKVSNEAAIATMSAAGFVVIVSRVASGWFLDRTHAPRFAAGVFAVTFAGVLLLLSQGGGITPLVAILLVAVCAGAEVDLMAYLVARYFPLSSYGRVYGAMFFVFSLANGIGPLIAGAMFDRYQSYDAALWIFAAGLVAACALLLSLGPYRYPPTRADRPREDAVAATSGS